MSDPPVFATIDPREQPAILALRAYFAELDARFPGGFDPGDTLTADAPGFLPPGGAFLVAMAEDAPVACGGLVRIDTETVEMKRMWVHADRRGTGLGRRLLETLEARAGELGYGRVVLDTNASLTEAIAMYRRAGYRRIERYNDNPYAQLWFEKRLDPITTTTGSPVTDTPP